MLAKFGKIDVLMNLAGGGRPIAATDVTVEEWEGIFNAPNCPVVAESLDGKTRFPTHASNAILLASLFLAAEISSGSENL